MKTLAVVALATLLMTAFSAADASKLAHHKHAQTSRHQLRPVQPAEPPVTRLPIPIDSFRA